MKPFKPGDIDWMVVLITTAIVWLVVSVVILALLWIALTHSN